MSYMNKTERQQWIIQLALQAFADSDILPETNKKKLAVNWPKASPLRVSYLLISFMVFAFAGLIYELIYHNIRYSWWLFVPIVIIIAVIVYRNYRLYRYGRNFVDMVNSAEALKKLNDNVKEYFKKRKSQLTQICPDKNLLDVGHLRDENERAFCSKYVEHVKKVITHMQRVIVQLRAPCQFCTICPHVPFPADMSIFIEQTLSIEVLCKELFELFENHNKVLIEYIDSLGVSLMGSNITDIFDVTVYELVPKSVDYFEKNFMDMNKIFEKMMFFAEKNFPEDEYITDGRYHEIIGPLEEYGRKLEAQYLLTKTLYNYIKYELLPTTKAIEQMIEGLDVISKLVSKNFNAALDKCIEENLATRPIVPNERFMLHISPSEESENVDGVELGVRELVEAVCEEVIAQRIVKEAKEQKGGIPAFEGATTYTLRPTISRSKSDMDKTTKSGAAKEVIVLKHAVSNVSITTTSSGPQSDVTTGESFGDISVHTTHPPISHASAYRTPRPKLDLPVPQGEKFDKLLSSSVTTMSSEKKSVTATPVTNTLVPSASLTIVRAVAVAALSAAAKAASSTSVNGDDGKDTASQDIAHVQKILETVILNVEDITAKKAASKN